MYLDPPVLQQLMRTMHGVRTTEQMLRDATEEARNQIQAEDIRQQNTHMETLRRIHTEGELEVLRVHNNQRRDEINEMRRRLEERDAGDASSDSIRTISKDGENTETIHGPHEKNKEESSGEAIIGNALKYTANDNTIDLVDTSLEDSAFEASKAGKDTTENADTIKETIKIAATYAKTIENTATNNEDQDDDGMGEEVPEDQNKAEVYISGSDNGNATRSKDSVINITIDGSDVEDSGEEGEPLEHTLSFDSHGDVKEDNDLREVSPSSVHPKWKTKEDAHNRSSDREDLLESEDGDLVTINNIAKTPETANKATEEAPTNASTEEDTSAHNTTNAPEASSEATKTKKAPDDDDKPKQTKEAEEEASGEETPMNVTNAKDALNAVVNDEEIAARSNILAIQPAVQPPSQDEANLHELVLQELGNWD